MGKKGIQKSSRRAKAKSKSSSDTACGKFGSHVNVIQHDGRDVRVYGDAEPGEDTIYEDSVGLFCCTDKFMQAVTQCMTKFYKRHDFHMFGHVYVSLEGKGAVPVKKKGNAVQIHRGKLLKGQGYLFETKHREEFIHVVRLGDPLCLLRLEAFVSEDVMRGGRGYAGAKIWTSSSKATVVGEAFVEDSGVSNTKSKRDRKAERRARKKRELRQQRDKIRADVRKQRLYQGKEEQGRPVCSDEVHEMKQMDNELDAPCVPKKTTMVPPAPSVNPWGVQKATSKKPLVEDALFAKVSASDDHTRLWTASTVVEAQKNDESPAPQGWKVVGSPLSGGWDAVESVLPVIGSHSLWGAPTSTITSSTSSSTSDVVSQVSESLEAASSSTNGTHFYSVTKNHLWLRDWLEEEAKLTGHTLDAVYEAFTEEQMDSKLGIEYLSEMTFAELKAELADMNITKRGVVSKLRSALKRLFV